MKIFYVSFKTYCVIMIVNFMVGMFIISGLSALMETLAGEGWKSMTPEEMIIFSTVMTFINSFKFRVKKEEK